MRLIFCGDPLDPRVPDPAYAEEVTAASSLGIDYSLVNFEALVYDQDARKSHASSPPQWRHRPAWTCLSPRGNYTTIDQRVGLHSPGITLPVLPNVELGL